MPAGNRTRSSATKRSLDFDENNKKAAGSPVVVDLVASDSPTAAVTPSKKKKKRYLDDFFKASPSPSTAGATPSKTSAAAAAVVTPPDTKRSKATERKSIHQPGQDEKYVPTYLNKNVEYFRTGEAELDPVTTKVFELVTKHYSVPDGFENARSFGPKSGVTFEQRVITSYSNNLFQPKKTGVEVDICTSCAEEGHKRDDCPTLF